MDKYPYISIVVPVLNRERTIGRCIQSLLEIDYPSYEIIVVDNGSTDKTYEILSNFPIKLVREEKKGPYAARNKGIDLSKGELVLFTDSDCLANKDLLKKLLENLRDENIVGVGGQLQTYEPATLTEQFEDLAGILVIDLPKGIVRKKKNKFLSGAIYASNVLFRKKALVEINGFDPDFMSGGDFDLCWRLQRAGHKLYFDPQAIVKHIHRANLRGLIKQFFKYAVEQPRLLKKQPGSFSYIQLKTYLWPKCEFRSKLPIRMLISIDFFNLFLLGLIMTLISPLFLYFSLGVFLFILLGLFRDSLKAVKRSGKLKWLLLFGLFHIVRSYSFTIGRIWGGIRHKVIAF